MLPGLVGVFGRIVAAESSHENRTSAPVTTAADVRFVHCFEPLGAVQSVRNRISIFSKGCGPISSAGRPGSNRAVYPAARYSATASG